MKNSLLYIQKKAVSDIVATVLIIMITVAAVGIIGAIVVPMVKNSMTASNFCSAALSDLYIDEVSGFSCLDSEKNVLVIKVNKGSAEIPYKGIRTSVTIEGNTYSDFRESSFSNPSEVFYWNVSELSELGKIETLDIYPVILIGKKPKECDRSSSIKVSSCAISSSIIDQVTLAVFSTESTGNGGGSYTDESFVDSNNPPATTIDS